MIDLSNVTFIIPLRIDTDDRLRNIILTSIFLLNKFDCKVIVKESDEMRKFEAWALPLIQSVADTKNLTYVFEENTEDHFHRTRLLNEMVLMAETDIVVNYDSDIVLPISSYVKAKEMLDSKEFDVVYPYKFGEQGERKVTLNTKVEDEEDLKHLLNTPIVRDFVQTTNPEVLDQSFGYAQNVNGIGWAEYGMVQFFNKQVYLDGYLENENFIAYAPEDVERHHRWKLLGYNIGRVENHAYHLEHKRTQNSWFNNPFMQKNNELWEYLKNLSKEEVIEYYEKQEYVKEKLK
tara:strand:- start:7143 stop:8015 length:873 start_codon:yes stop_codon:yes gene_type:complete